MRDPSTSPGCCQALHAEFQKQKFGLHHEQPEDFCRSLWQCSHRSWIWLIYRWCLAAFFASGVISSLIIQFQQGRWWIYLTDWGFLLCMFCCTYGAVIATIYFINPNYFGSGSVSLKIYWASYWITLVLAILITLVFWSFLFPLMPEMGGSLYNLWAHAFNSVLMVIDYMLVAFPTRLMHFVYPTAMGLAYGIFSLIYYCVGGTDPMGNNYIYPILQWSQPGLAIGTICGCGIALSAFCLLLFWLYQLRMWLFVRCKKNTRNVATA